MRKLKTIIFTAALALYLTASLAAQTNQRGTARLPGPPVLGAYELVEVSHLSTPAFVAWRQSGPNKQPRPLVMLNHAAGQTERMWLDLPQFRTLSDALTDAGYIIVASRLTDHPPNGYNSWGNQGSLDANAELYEFVAANYPVDSSRVAMSGDSMGGLSTLLAIPDGRVPVKCAALYYPVVNLRGQYDYNSQMAGGIRVAYGINPDGSNYAVQTAGHDPILRPASDFAGVHLRFYGGDGDTIVLWNSQARAFLARVAGVAREASAVRLDGNHNSGVETTANDLVAFYKRCME